MASFKIVVPKVGSSNKLGTDARLYVLDEIVDAKEDWQASLMQTFVANNWAVETKMDSISDVETSEPVRARDDKGHYAADDASTPDANEAYEGGVKPKAAKKRAKKTTKKKSD